MKYILLIIISGISLILNIGCEKDDNKTGQNLSNQVADTVYDIEGNAYKTVIIGTKLWMSEDLAAKHYNDGTPIKGISDRIEWWEARTSAYCYPNFDSIYRPEWAGNGKLYNGYAVKTEKLCPIGWHVSTNDEWDELYDLFNGNNTSESERMLAVADSIVGVYNSVSKIYESPSGFNALMNGLQGDYYFSGKGSWWSNVDNSDSLYYYTVSNLTGAFQTGHSNETYPAGFNGFIFGCSIRCVKD